MKNNTNVARTIGINFPAPRNEKNKNRNKGKDRTRRVRDTGGARVPPDPFPWLPLSLASIGLNPTSWERHSVFKRRHWTCV